jgi:hypothetical protein
MLSTLSRLRRLSLAGRVALLAGVGTLVAGAAVATTVAVPGVGTGPGPLSPTTVTAAQSGSAPDLAVSWVPSPAGTPATGAVVQLSLLAGGTPEVLGQITCSASCTSTIFRGLSFGSTYEALVTPTDAAGSGVPVTSLPASLSTTCTAGACVAFNANDPISAATHAASGILDSLYPTADDPADLAALHTTMWRGGPGNLGNGKFDWSSWNVAVAAGAQTTMVLSDMYKSAYSGDPPTPWSNWTAYNTEITTLVTQLSASGEQINYWEPYNEPGGNDGYYSAAGYASETPALLLQQFLDTYQDIKSVLPNAAIIGPSLEHWSDYPGQYGSDDHAFEMETFLQFAASNNLQLAAISWHEIDDSLGPNPEENSLFPAIIEDHVAEARRLIAALPALGNPLIFINEFGMPDVSTIPGWDVAYLAALTDAGVNSADRACWSDTCGNPALDGLLGDDGVSTPAIYYERLLYASMSGNMISAGTNSDTVTALGSYDSSKGTLTGLIGRGVGCAGDSLCTGSSGLSSTDASPTSVDVSVTVPWSTGAVHIALTDYQGQSYSAQSAPLPTVSTQNITATGAQTGTVTFSIPSFADGDAYGLVITHTTLSEGTYVPLTPARITDTRAGSGFPNAGGTLAPGGTLNVAVAGAGGVPTSGVSAVVLNVAATNVSAPSGFVTAYPEGAPRPSTANLLTSSGHTVSNLVTVGVGPTGGVTFYNSTGSADLVVDVEGYYTSTVGQTGLYDAVTPDRVYGSTSGGSPIAAGATQAVSVTGGNTGVPADASAVVFNLTASDETSAGYLTAYPAGESLPEAANLTFGADQVVGNRVTVPVGEDGQVDIYNFTGITGVDVDLDGYYTGSASEPGSAFVALATPVRLVDTRSSTGGTPIAPGTTETFSLAQDPAIPAAAVTVAANVTVVAGGAPGFLTNYPSTAAGPPLAADLDWTAGALVPNFTLVPLNGSDTDFFASAGDPVNVVVDAFGYFVPG